MNDTDRKNVAKLFNKTDLLLIPYGDEDGALLCGAAKAKSFIKYGKLEYDFDGDVLYNAGCDCCESSEAYFEVYEPLDNIKAKLKRAGITMYTPDTLDAFLKANGVSFRYTDIEIP